MKKNLFISYYFSPFSGAGAYRSTKFAKYLPCYNWQPIVLTIDEEYYGDNIDASLLRDISISTKVIRTKMFPEIKNKFLNKVVKLCSIPDSKIWWMFYAYRVAKKTVQEKQINIIYATGDPFSSFIFAYLLAKKCRIKFIIDFRDAWVLDPRNQKKNLFGKFHLWMSRPLFKKVLKEASAIILATDGMYRDFLTKFPQYKDRLFCINNGFDDEDFKKIKYRKDSKFNIAFSGSFSADRSPEYFFEAIKFLKNTRSDIYNKLRINFYGFIDNIFIKKAQNLGVIKFHGPTKHDILINNLQGTDLLVFIGERVPGNQQITSSKVFEYIALHKPILTLCPKEMGGYKIIQESGLGVFCDINNYQDIANKIIKTVMGEIKIHLNIEYINQYNRKKITHKLAQILDQLS